MLGTGFIEKVNPKIQKKNREFNLQHTYGLYFEQNDIIILKSPSIWKY